MISCNESVAPLTETLNRVSVHPAPFAVPLKSTNEKR